MSDPLDERDPAWVGRQGIPTLRIFIKCLECDSLLLVAGPDNRLEFTLAIAPCERCMEKRAGEVEEAFRLSEEEPSW
jgi:hypothetical protein